MFSKNPVESFEGYRDIKIDPYRTMVEQSVTNSSNDANINIYRIKNKKQWRYGLERGWIL